MTTRHWSRSWARLIHSKLSIQLLQYPFQYILLSTPMSSWWSPCFRLSYQECVCISLPCLLHSLPISSKESIQVRGPAQHFVTYSFLRWWVVNPTGNPEVGGPPIVGCPQLLIQYIRSYPPYLEAVYSTPWGRAMPWRQGAHSTWAVCVLRKENIDVTYRTLRR
jgi:hypothetical protein